MNDDAGKFLGMTFDDPDGVEPDHGQDVKAIGERRGTGVSRWSLLLLVLAITLAVVLGQNTERVTVEVLWAKLSCAAVRRGASRRAGPHTPLGAGHLGAAPSAPASAIRLTGSHWGAAASKRRQSSLSKDDSDRAGSLARSPSRTSTSPVERLT